VKTSAEKSSTTTPAAAMHAAKQPFFAKKGGGDFFAPAVQMKMAVSKPGDKLEQEADRMADKVMRIPSPVSLSPEKEEKLQRAPDEKLQKKEKEKIQKAAAPEEKIQKKEDEKLQKAPASEEKLQRKGSDGAPFVNANLQSAIQSRSGGGQPLSSDVRGYMEPRFNADFSKVRVHSNQEAAALSNQLSARAFTHQNNIFFSRNQYQPGSSDGRQLLAHELTHTIQQGHALQRSPQVSITASPPAVQRLFGFDLDPRSFFASAAAAIPGFTMLTVVIGSNPITGASVDRSPGNILRGAIEMIPVAGALISQALDNHGVFEKVSVWASQQFNTLSSIGGSIRQSIADFISNFDILSPGAMLERGKQIITEPIARIKNFAANLKDGIVTFIKDAILKPIAAFAKANVPNGYDLLCAVLGKDPISGEPVPQTAENLIAPFMKLIGQEEVWENMKKSNAIGRAWAWFQKALGTVMGFVQELPTLFMNAFKALEVIDIVLIPRAFSKLVGVFGGFAARFISWAGTAVWNLLEIIFDAVSPGALGYIKKTGSAIKSIFQNPLPFVGNLVKAAKQGFLNFAANIGGHLKAGLIDWLTGSLSGVYIPKALNLAELGKFALSILGITWAQIRGKIVKVLGPSGEKIMQGLETGFDIVVALVKGGPAAAWELIKEKLTDLKDTVVNGIVGFVTDTVVKKAIPKLIAMFIPGAGFISAIISIYDTVMVFVEKISKIIQVVTAFIDSIVTIAAGNITAAANRVESILGGLLSLAISFLAGFLGLGKITDKIKAVIQKIRLTVDKAIDAVIGWIVGKAKALFGKLFGKRDQKEENKVRSMPVKEGFSMGPAEHTLTAVVGENDQVVKITMASPQDIIISAQLGSAIDLIQSDKEVDSKGNPVKREKTQQNAILLDLNAAKTQVDNLREEYVKAGKPEAFDKFIKPRLANIIGNLTKLAKKKPEITSLKPLISLGKPRYIPKGWDIRKKLYDATGGWTAKSKSMRTLHIGILEPRLKAILKLRDDKTKSINYTSAQAQWVAMQNAREIPSVKNAPSFANYNHIKDFAKLKFETDHNPSLGMAWNSSEKNQDDNKRNMTLLGAGVSTLKVITKEENQERAADKSINPDFDRDIGPNFESAVANSPKGSMLLDGKPFDDNL
jgi:hypothetical protein